ncbi:MAG: hypothetical protein R3E86_03480 [Pseudomonadales bacterium]
MWRAPSLALLCALSLTAAANADVLLDDALGRWLDASLSPELAQTLSRHPRFKGATFRFAAIEDGAPAAGSNLLIDAVAERLTRNLRAVEGIRLALPEPPVPCRVPQRIDYLIGIEIKPTRGNSANVSIGAVDLDESVWVSGVSYQWQGRLSGNERRALSSRTALSVAGAADSPLPIADVEQIAAAIGSQLECSLPHGIDGPVYLSTPADPELARVSMALRGKLLITPLAAVTGEPDLARWALDIERRAAGALLGELRVSLKERSGAAQQQVASVFVTGASFRPAPSTAAAPASEPPASSFSLAPASADLLSTLRLRPAEASGICDYHKARVNACAEVEFDLRESAYLFVFSTQSRAVRGIDCASGLTRVDPGTRRFRLRVPPAQLPVPSDAALAEVTGRRRPDAGRYVLATRDRRAARALQRSLQAAPAACGDTHTVPIERWLDGLTATLTEHTGQISWRALQLAHETEGITRL